MRGRIFDGLKATALFALFMIVLGVAMAGGYCIAEFEGPIGSQIYLDAICPLDEPRSLYKGNAMHLLFNKLAAPIFLGVALLLTCAMLAVWVALFVPEDSKPPKREWPGRPQGRPRKQRHNGPGGDGAPHW